LRYGNFEIRDKSARLGRHMTGISVEIRRIGLRWAMIALAFLATVINYSAAKWFINLWRLVLGPFGFTSRNSRPLNGHLAARAFAICVTHERAPGLVAGELRSEETAQPGRSF
jgi:hypothetical protein